MIIYCLRIFNKKVISMSFQSNLFLVEIIDNEIRKKIIISIIFGTKQKTII